MKGNPEIKNRFNGTIIVPTGKYTSIKEAVEKEYLNLTKANLSGADLREANLRGADLSGADLREANLSGADLREADLSGADLREADLRKANLREADLRKANLREADLRGADFRGADLSGADLSGANLREADLRGADLRAVKNLLPEYLLPDLYLLKLMPPNTVLTAWKYIKDGKSPYQNSIYKVGQSYKETDYCEDEKELCGKGLNVATLQWCLRDCLENNIELLEVKFKASDIIAIPYATDGKFRVKAFEVLRKITRKNAEKILKECVK